MTTINGVDQVKEVHKLNIGAQGLLIDASELLLAMRDDMTIPQRQHVVRWLRAVRNWQREFHKGDRC